MPFRVIGFFLTCQDHEAGAKPCRVFFPMHHGGEDSESDEVDDLNGYWTAAFRSHEIWSDYCSRSLTSQAASRSFSLKILTYAHEDDVQHSIGSSDWVDVQDLDSERVTGQTTDTDCASWCWEMPWEVEKLSTIKTLAHLNSMLESDERSLRASRLEWELLWWVIVLDWLYGPNPTNQFEWVKSTPSAPLSVSHSGALKDWVKLSQSPPPPMFVSTCFEFTSLTSLLTSTTSPITHSLVFIPRLKLFRGLVRHPYL